ncbi:MAG: ABC-F family ATP-binding cassette domain-containing protein [Defluviitaleaceae bacterium]|nr:ABC-F family ATP-binding cassette domain-containing protein [Defluviitaleaceae bacterium]
MIISCKDIQKSFGATTVLRGVSFMVEEKEKMALVGVNGAGKTTLFKIVLGELAADSGEIALKKGARMAYLSQHMDLAAENTIYDELLSVFDHLADMEADIRRMEAEMAALTGDALERLMEKYTRLTKEFEDNRGYEYKSRVRGVLAGLGFNEVEHTLEIAKLSGGQKTRVALGKLLLEEPDLLLLDEPTNHLDIAAITWLEDYFLREYEKAVIIISHDRYFLDKVAKKVVEIEHGKAKSYRGNYSSFLEQKARDFEIEMHQYTSQQKEIAKQMESIRLLRSFNREKSIRRARSKEKQLAKIDRKDRPQNAPDKMRLKLVPTMQSGNDVLTIRNAKKTFDDGYTLFENMNIEIKRGEKVALIGENGVGKTTLFSMLRNGDEAVTLGTNVKIGYYDQELKFDNAEKSIFQEISDTYPRMKNLEIRNALASFLFMGDEIDKKLGTLSGGERGRVALCKLMLSDINFLLLDEPTNHLDLFSKEILENALIDYEGTALYISHDRYFINNTAEKIYELKKEGSAVYLGNYDYYIDKKAEISTMADIAPAGAALIRPNTNKDDYLRNKEEAAIARKNKARIEKLEMQIEEAEAAIASLDEELAKDEIATDATKAQEVYLMKAAQEEKLAALLEEWEKCQMD